MLDAAMAMSVAVHQIGGDQGVDVGQEWLDGTVVNQPVRFVLSDLHRHRGAADLAFVAPSRASFGVPTGHEKKGAAPRRVRERAGLESAPVPRGPARWSYGRSAFTNRTAGDSRTTSPVCGAWITLPPPM